MDPATLCAVGIIGNGASLEGGEATRDNGDLAGFLDPVVRWLTTDGAPIGTGVISGPRGVLVLRLEALLELLWLNGDLGRAPARRPLIEDIGYLLLATLSAARDLTDGAYRDAFGDSLGIGGEPCLDGDALSEGA